MTQPSQSLRRNEKTAHDLDFLPKGAIKRYEEPVPYINIDLRSGGGSTSGQSPSPARIQD